MMNEFVSLFMPLVYAFLLSAGAFLLLVLVLTVRKRSKNGAVQIPVGVSGISEMTPKSMTAPFRWWAKHPWMVFWCTFPLYFVIRASLGWFTTPYFVFLLSATILILSFIQGIFLTWQRSGIRGVLINVAALFFVGIFAGTYIASLAPYARREYDSNVKRNLKNAAKAEEAYYRDNGSYTANIGNLKGFNQSAYVVIAVEATATTYVIIGSATKRCEPDTGRWAIDSTTGAINGTPCRVTMYGLSTMTPR